MKIYESFNESGVLKALGPYKEGNADKSYVGIKNIDEIEFHGSSTIYGSVEIHGTIFRPK